MGRGALSLLLLSLIATTTAEAAALSPKQQSPPTLASPSIAPAATATTAAGGSSGVSSNSVLVALLDSCYTELSELVEKALLLQPLEAAVGRGNVTILAPRNEALERDLDTEFRRFLLEPRNLRSL